MASAKIRVPLLSGPVILKSHPVWAAQLGNGSPSGIGTVLPNCLTCRELGSHSSSLGLGVLVQDTTCATVQSSPGSWPE